MTRKNTTQQRSEVEFAVIPEPGEVDERIAIVEQMVVVERMVDVERVLVAERELVPDVRKLFAGGLAIAETVAPEMVGAASVVLSEPMAAAGPMIVDETLNDALDLPNTMNQEMVSGSTVVHQKRLVVGCTDLPRKSYYVSYPEQEILDPTITRFFRVVQQDACYTALPDAVGADVQTSSAVTYMGGMLVTESSLNWSAPTAWFSILLMFSCRQACPCDGGQRPVYHLSYEFRNRIPSSQKYPCRLQLLKLICKMLGLEKMLTECAQAVSYWVDYRRGRRWRLYFESTR
ncbi:hypothetical protein K469DRAFT_686857 [Zopfia rhizophila CBS 207.26]|uniref:Uncharacterized protein n=1 Tax=Zopfia rhizophila CBS 207.26 TaxID=1314779 RepID=A0A6A6E790_9PEZI|nr:hypothetical protein K469DRAFT_686857 [Zopfia rhizophila CBS 207.26]